MKLIYPLVALLPLALAQEPQMGDLIAQADKFLSERAFDQALDSYDKALERQKSQGADAVEDPIELSRVMYRRGTVLLLKDKQQLALDDFEAALALNPQMHKATIKIAEALLRQGEFLKSIERLEPLGALKGMDERDRKRILDGANSGLVNSEAAAKAYQTILESQDGETPVDKMHAESCILHATEALKVAKKSTTLHKYKANCHLALGQAQSALVDLSYLQVANPADIQLAQEMAQIYFYMLYEPDKALQQIRQKCLRQDPENKTCGKLAKEFRKRDKVLKPGMALLESKRDRKPADPLYERLFKEWVDEGLFDDIVRDTRVFMDSLTIPPIDRIDDVGGVSNLVGNMEEVLCEAYSKQTQKKANKPPASRAVFCDLVSKRDEHFVPAVILKANKLVDAEQFEEADRLLAEQVQYWQSLGDSNKVQVLRNRQQEVAVLLKQSKSKDYYKILGIARDATDKDIKKGYRAQSKLYHPDKYKGDLDETAVERKMAEINEAYEILSDPDKRAAFDSGGEFDGQGQHQPQNPFGGGGGGFQFQQGGGGFDFAAMFQEQMKQQARQGHGGGQRFQQGFRF
ncbi:DnaJ-like protein subfamily C member 7 [Yarrowia sp. B02]|nr:DnaJ-like protein subfamily C member 7 [Yarrowia sp. B02]